MTLTVRGHLERSGGFRLSLDACLPDQGVTAIIGTSGSGKSTILRVVAGLERNANFSVQFRGDDWQSDRHWMPPHERPIAMVQQQPSLFPHLSVLGNLRAVANATNRVAVLAQNLAAVGGFRQERVPGVGFALGLLPAALAGSWLGAWIASSLPEQLFARAFGAIMLLALPVILLNPRPRPSDQPRGQPHQPQPLRQPGQARTHAALADRTSHR